VSNYLWYGLDAWGRNNPASDQPQCTDTGDCFGQDFEIQKCCGAIALSEGSANGENIYMYRCLDRGLIGSIIEFRLGDSIDVRA